MARAFATREAKTRPGAPMSVKSSPNHFYSAKEINKSTYTHTYIYIYIYIRLLKIAVARREKEAIRYVLLQLMFFHYFFVMKHETSRNCCCYYFPASRIPRIITNIKRKLPRVSTNCYVLYDCELSVGTIFIIRR